MIIGESGGGLPRVRIPQPVWTRLWAYIRACPVEVGGLGSVVNRHDGLVITDVFLLKQKVGTAHTNLDTAAVREFVLDWIKQGKDPEQLKFWWHSHAHFPVGWSPTDEDTIRRMTESSLLVTCVGNHRGEVRTRITTAAPERCAFDFLALDVIPEIGEEARAKAEAEVAEKVSQETWRDRYSRRFRSIGMRDDAPVSLPEDDGKGWYK